MLLVNADATQGELRVRVSDERRKVVPGFDYTDCEAFTGNAVAHTVKWRGVSLDALRGRTLRFEFQLRDTDLYTFRARQASLLRISNAGMECETDSTKAAPCCN